MLKSNIKNQKEKSARIPSFVLAANLHQDCIPWHQQTISQIHRVFGCDSNTDL